MRYPLKLFTITLAVLVSACSAATPLSAPAGVPAIAAPSNAAPTIPPVPPLLPTLVDVPTLVPTPAASTLGPTPPALATTAPPIQAAPSVTPGGGLTLSETDKGRVVNVRAGDQITVVLHSTYWDFKNVTAPNVLQQVGDVNYAPDMQGSIPGSGAGTVTVVYKAVAPGRADIAASRTTCGEALRCTPDQMAWQVTIVVQ